MSAGLAAVSVLALAVALDVAFGDPPNRVHPVAWMGRALGAGRRALCAGGPAALLLKGALLTLGVAAAAAAAGWLVAAVAARLGPAGLLLEALVLTTMLSLRGLASAAREVAVALAAGDLEAGRARVAFHLVSRPTAALDTGLVASAAIESVAENLTDSLLGPACFFLAFGLPGAMAYRAVSTADSMLGYREGALEHFGKAAARLDDVLNWLPARLAGRAIVAGALLARSDAAQAWWVMRRDAGRTASPNAGCTMAAMAGALGVRLEKPGAYRLGDGPLPAVGDIERSLSTFHAAALVGLAVPAVIRMMIGE